MQVMQPTRQSLLERLRDPSAERAWEDFYEMYWGVIVRYSQKQGLDEASAYDVLQETMVVLMRKLPEFEYNPSKGKFRNFLLTVVHRKGLSAMRRKARRPEVSIDSVRDADDSPMVERLEDDNVVLPHEIMESQWRESMQEEALRRVRDDPRVKERTFEVFRSYVIDGEPAPLVAQQFEIKENAVYQVKDRMIKRLEQEISKLVGEIEG